MHMLVWVKDLSLIRANLLHASIPWANANDAFLVADTQKSSSSCLPLSQARDSFMDTADGRTPSAVSLHARRRVEKPPHLRRDPLGSLAVQNRRPASRREGHAPEVATSIVYF